MMFRDVRQFGYRLCALALGGVALAFSAQPSQAMAASADAIVWRLENPFRLFKRPLHTSIHENALKGLGEAARETPVLSSEEHLGRIYAMRGWASSIYTQTCWNPARASYDACDGLDNYVNPKAHRVVVSLRPDVASNESETDSDAICRWEVSFRNNKSPLALEHPCIGSVTISVPYPSGADVQVLAGNRVLGRTEIAVKDLFVVGIGDSFASGEGNPDVPVRFSPTRVASYGALPSGEALAGLPARLGNWKEIGDAAFLKQRAQWMSRSCHRSLYSHQTRAALQLALENPQRAVTFVSFACAGAEVVKGLFLTFKGNEWSPAPPKESQLSAVARVQCGGASAPVTSFPEAYRMRGAIPELKDVRIRKCPREKARKIDLMFVSIGGNDVGFAGIVGNTILDDTSRLRQIGGWVGSIIAAPEAEARLKTLPVLYKALNRAIHNILHVPWNESDRIVLTAYPSLSTRKDGAQQCPTTRLGLEVFPDFELDQKREAVSARFAGSLDKAMAATSRRYGWSYVSSHRRKFFGHSICAGSWEIEPSLYDDLRLPRFVNQRWYPYPPTQYAPYAPRQRWFRTPNDAFLTTNFHIARGSKILKFNKLTWFQLLIASTYSGAFHPTAQGQAAIADSVVERARVVLAQYGQQ